MKKEELIKKLEKLSFQETLLESHKHRLKLLLTPSLQSKHSWLKLRNALNFAYFFRSFLKKFIVFALVTALVIFINLSRTNFTEPQDVFAYQILNQALDDISKSKPQNEQTQKKALFIKKILEKAKKSKELEYIGDEVRKDGTQIKNLKFTDPDLPQDLIIKININNPLLDSVDFQFPDMMHQAHEVILGDFKDGQIVDKDRLQQQLLDPTIKQEWIKELVRWRNQDCLEKFDSRPIDKNLFSPTQNADQKKLSQELKPFIISAEVLVIGCHEGLSYDSNEKLTKFSLTVYSLGNQLKKLADAQNIVDQAIIKLSAVQTDDAKARIELLRKARNSKTLQSTNSTNQNGEAVNKMSFLDKSFASTAIDIFIDKNSNQPVQFRFTPDANSKESRNVIEVIQGTFQDDPSKNLALFKDDELKNYQEKDLLLQLIIHPQNEEWLKQNFINGPPGIDQAAFNLFKPIAESSEVLLQGFPYYNKGVNNEIEKFALSTYSFSKQKKYAMNPAAYQLDSQKFLDTLIQKMSKFNSEEANFKSEILNILKEATYDGYDGDSMNPDEYGIYHPDKDGIYNNSNPNSLLRKRFQRFRFTLNLEGRKFYTSFLYDPSDDSENSLKIDSSYFSDGTAKSLQGTISNGKITNLEELKSQLVEVKNLPAWLKHLIQLHNQSWMKWNFAPMAQCAESKELIEQLKPIIEQSEVMVTDLLCPGTIKEKSTSFSLNIYSMVKK